MKIAVVSDIHGNAFAFDAVLNDLKGEPYEEAVCLGDAIQGGAQPGAVAARLRELRWPVVLGNADAWLVTGTETTEAATPPWMLAVRDWSLARLSDDDRQFIATFTPTVEIDLVGDRSLLCAHGTPRSFDEIIVPETPDAEVDQLLGPITAAVVCGGHTHVQQLRPLGDRLFFNPGSVSLPFRRDTDESPPPVHRWAEYAMVTATDSGQVRVEFRRVPYDVEASIAAINASGMPEAERLSSRYQEL